MALRLGRAFVRFQVGDITGNFNYSTETIGREDESTWRIKRRNAKWKLYSVGREKDGWLEVASYDTTKRVRSIKGNAALSGSKQLGMYWMLRKVLLFFSSQQLDIIFSVTHRCLRPLSELFKDYCRFFARVHVEIVPEKMRIQKMKDSSEYRR